MLSPIDVVVVGDSTATGTGTPPAIGWAPKLPHYLDPAATVIDRAFAGRSCRNYISEGLWDVALSLSADFVLIQFGHNDEKPDHRYSHPDRQYRDYLRFFIDSMVAVGTTPILVSPLSRDLPVTDTLKSYAIAARSVATEKSVDFIDLHRFSRALWGNNVAAWFHDSTHTTDRGALQVAKIIAAELPPSLQPYVLP